MKKGKYTPEKAHEFVQKLKKEIVDLKALGRKWTLFQAINFINGKVDALPADIQAAFTIFNIDSYTDVELQQPITDYDFDLVIAHLDKQDGLIKIYLK